jgi:8-oxo-dGTP pyrophosphatase MutT (NUDIX family)
MRRGPTAKFMPNTYVFPGGLVDKSDKDFPLKSSNYDSVDAQPIKFNGFDNDYPLRIAALRELFEEAGKHFDVFSLSGKFISGILLTYDSRRRTSEFVTEKDDNGFAEWRQKVLFLHSCFQFHFR